MNFGIMFMLVVIFKKTSLIFLCVQLFYSLAYASPAGEIAKEQLTEKMRLLEERQEICIENILNDLNLSISDAKIALPYWYLVHNQNCIREALGDYYIALSTAEAFFPEEIAMSDGDFNFANRRNLLEGQIKYLALPEKIRVKIEQSKELMNPFSSKSVINALNVLNKT